MSVSAAASDHTPDVDAISRPEAPMPRKKITIIARRPQRSPSRPAGSEPRPNITNAPAVYGIRSCQTMPQSAAMAPTAVAKIRRKRWSSAWPALRRAAVERAVDMAQILQHDWSHLSTRSLPRARLSPSRRVGALQLHRDDGRDGRARLARARADELAAARGRRDEHAHAAAVLRGRGGRGGRRSIPPYSVVDADRRGPGAHRLDARRARLAGLRDVRARAAPDPRGRHAARARACGAPELHARRRRRGRAHAGARGA